ncbi:MAG TPA: hypothetical protein VM737_06740 [Gemmatimonadota bacterium]|nr:hypothetical protein [Gemmatimonadota bacterium]
MTVTTLDVPFGDRADFMSFLEEYFLPGTQLNPKVLNARVLTHSWGSTGDQVVLVAEYATWADIDADCGAPCETYFEQHEAPEEGESGYEEYQDKLALFNKYYSKHQDEIYVTQMRRAVVEGEMQGVVGPQPQEEEEED